MRDETIFFCGLCNDVPGCRTYGRTGFRSTAALAPLLSPGLRLSTGCCARCDVDSHVNVGTFGDVDSFSVVHDGYARSRISCGRCESAIRNSDYTTLSGTAVFQLCGEQPRRTGRVCAPILFFQYARDDLQFYSDELLDVNWPMSATAVQQLRSTKPQQPANVLGSVLPVRL